MKEELQGKLVEILTSIQTATGRASDFAMQQLPDIAQSYVAYGRVVSMVYVLVSLFAVGVGAYLLYRFWTKPWYSTWAHDAGRNVRAESNWVVLIFTSIVIGFAASGFVASISGAALVWLAPKVWLLKELASLIK